MSSGGMVGQMKEAEEGLADAPHEEERENRAHQQIELGPGQLCRRRRQADRQCDGHRHDAPVPAGPGEFVVHPHREAERRSIHEEYRPAGHRNSFPASLSITLPPENASPDWGGPFLSQPGPCAPRVRLEREPAAARLRLTVKPLNGIGEQSFSALIAPSTKPSPRARRSARTVGESLYPCEEAGAGSLLKKIPACRATRAAAICDRPYARSGQRRLRPAPNQTSVLNLASWRSMKLSSALICRRKRSLRAVVNSFVSRARSKSSSSRRCVRSRSVEERSRRRRFPGPGLRIDC